VRQPEVSCEGDHHGQASLEQKEHLPRPPCTGWLLFAGLSSKARKDKIAYDAAEGAPDCSLAVEERQAPSKLEARVEEGEVGDGNRIESS
jgi:hypothetical protein